LFETGFSERPFTNSVDPVSGHGSDLPGSAHQVSQSDHMTMVDINAVDVQNHPDFSDNRLSGCLNAEIIVHFHDAVGKSSGKVDFIVLEDRF